MTWAKLDDRMHADPRTEAAGVEAMGLWAMALSYMADYCTDGRISLARCRRLAGSQKGKRFADRLVAAGWWEAHEDGYRLLGWEAYLIPRDASEERSARAADAGRKGGKARAASAKIGGKVEARPQITSASYPDSCGGSSDCKNAEALESGQATRAPDPVPDPTQEERAQARDHAREDPQGVGQAIPFGPSEVTTSPEATAIPPGTVLPLFPSDPTATPLPASSTRRKADATGAAEQVHEAYCSAREKAGLKGRPPVLDAKRRKLVAARLKDGFTPEDLCAAARGVWRSDWHREQGQTSLDLVLRDSAHVERFREEHDGANNSPPPDRGPFKLRPVPDVPPERVAARVAEIEAMLAERRARAVAHG